MPLTQPASVPLRLQSGWNTGISAGKVALSSMLNTWVTQSRATNPQPRSSPPLVAFSGVALCSACAAGFRAAPAPLEMYLAALYRDRGHLPAFSQPRLVSADA